MRQALMLTPIGWKGYAGSSRLDAVARGEKAMHVEVANDAECFTIATRWLDVIDVLAVHDDIFLTDMMLNIIAVAQKLGDPVEFRRVAADCVSVVDRVASAA